MPVITPSTTRELSPAEQLRHLLDTAERATAVRHSSPADVVAVIQQVDQIDQRLSDMEGQPFDLRSEQSRLEGLQDRLVREAERIVRQVRASGQAEQLNTSATWQRIQAVATERRNRLQRRIFIGAGALLVVGLLLFVVLPRLFPSPPRADVDAVSRLTQSGDYGAALAKAEAEQQSVPNDPEAWIWIGAIQLHQGNQAAADQAWANAQKLFNDDATFRNSRAIVLIQLGSYAAAEADANELIKSSNTAAEGYYLLGLSQSGQNKVPEALASLDQAAKLADQSGNGGLVVAAKMETQNLLQRAPIFPTPTP